MRRDGGSASSRGSAGRRASAASRGVGSDAAGPHKPHPEPVLKALELLEALPRDAAYVGDSPFDVAAARAAGVFAVAVGWGGIHRVDDAGAGGGSPGGALGALLDPLP